MINRVDNKVYDYSHNFENKRVIVKDSQGQETLIDASILTHNKQYHTVEIPVLDAVKKTLPAKVILIILLSDRIIHYYGTVRPTLVMGRIEVALYRGSEKEDRKHKRYKLLVDGIVDSMMIEGQVIALSKEIPVDVINISRGGVLIRGERSSFLIGAILRLRINMNEKEETSLFCKVVRMNEISTIEAEFGCQLENIEI